jgi:hypothetical protein
LCIGDAEANEDENWRIDELDLLLVEALREADL